MLVYYADKERRQSLMSLIIPQKALKSLEHEYSILRLIHHRNKNQHRVSIWWKHLNSLKRSLTKLIASIHQYNNSPNKPLEKALLKIAKHLHFVFVKKAYRAFNGVIALGQFITLGMALIAALAKIDHDVLQIKGVEDLQTTYLEDSGKKRGYDIDDIKMNDDLGEEVTVEELQKVDIGRREIEEPPSPKERNNEKKKPILSNDTSFDSMRPKQKKRHTSKTDKEKKQKKKKKSAIDEIFG